MIKNHKNSYAISIFLTNLNIGDVDTVGTWGGERPPPLSKNFREIFSPSPIELINNNPDKDF